MFISLVLGLWIASIALSGDALLPWMRGLRKLGVMFLFGRVDCKNFVFQEMGFCLGCVDCKNRMFQEMGSCLDVWIDRIAFLRRWVIACIILTHSPCVQNSGGRLHGGAITSLVDIIGSAAIFSTGALYSGVSVEINVSYLSEAPANEEIEIEAKALRVGKNIAVVSVDIRRKATGQLVAQGRHTKYLGTSSTALPSKL